MTETIIDVDGLRRRYGGTDDGFEAVRGVSFTVHKGELFALLGTNGAGKTSTLEMIEGLAPAGAGSVAVLGRDPYIDRADVRPRIGIMLQEGGFPSDLTVAEMAMMWAGMMADHRPISEALEVVDLGSRTDVKIRALSGGERRRLDLALALMGRPDVLFLDEPTTGLDPQSRRAAWELIRGLLDDGTTIVLTTHYLEEAEELADRIAIMDAGRIVTSGTAAEIAAAHPARISFELDDALLRADDGAVSPRVQLPPLNAQFHTTGRRVTVHTDEVQQTLTDLLGWANERGIALTGLNVRSGSLEQAFLAVASGEHREEITA
ncbi:ABC transporter ATP-binding protein [Phytoactinopolyspora halotolerans]|uniref:ABC transporter ATP-binding protein n=1 Tax=Phytoactinopolyspora halotolerans TaxID=1981512 RepID=A0A6L9S0W7_9ACTN|nr:ABC transporter ATP-binding protein [Phytoactinopolyspora halotolerans]NED98588.1 ABC transporter ATP-binding protein [Phytoactinopolyspora halotolerans]